MTGAEIWGLGGGAIGTITVSGGGEYLRAGSITAWRRGGFYPNPFLVGYPSLSIPLHYYDSLLLCDRGSPQLTSSKHVELCESKLKLTTQHISTFTGVHRGIYWRSLHK